MKKLYYIGERNNPQFKKPYYIAYGQLTKKDVKRKEKCMYGDLCITGFVNKEDYDNTLLSLKQKGFSIH